MTDYEVTGDPEIDQFLPDPVERQGVAVNQRYCVDYTYNNHDQNPVIILPGDLLFVVRSPMHDNLDSDTLILRSLPSLNMLLRSVGPSITPTQIWDTFKFLGVCECDWALPDEDPRVRGISITNVGFGCFRCADLFDDVSEVLALTSHSIPRHAYLWLRPFHIDPVTNRIEPFRARLVDMVKPKQSQETQEDLDARGGDDGQDSGDLDIVHPSLFADPDDEFNLQAEMDNWDNIGVEDENNNNAEMKSVASSRTSRSSGVKSPVTAARRMLQPDYPTKHEYFWQYVPVCSTHPDLEFGGKSTALRPADGNKHWFAHYNYCLYLGHMYNRPIRMKPIAMDQDIMRFAIFGPWGNTTYYHRVMLDSRHKLPLVDIVP